VPDPGPPSPNIIFGKIKSFPLHSSSLRGSGGGGLQLIILVIRDVGATALWGYFASGISQFPAEECCSTRDPSIRGHLFLNK